MQTTTESYGFKAEIKELLNILAHSLYKDRDIFLRELISNASDALTRLQFESLTNPDIYDHEAQAVIQIEIEESTDNTPAMLVIKDTGIGMTHDELVRNLGTIAQSGAREFLEKLGKGEIDAGDVIGQFGVGFYSVFMVAERVKVVSRSYLPEASSVEWSSDGGETFEITPAEKKNRGTEIHIILKPDATEYANVWRIKQIIKKYSDYVRFPILVEGEQANRRESLWRKSPSEVTPEEHKVFYRQLTMDFEEPLLTIHFSSDSPVNLRALLFIPRRRDRGVLAIRKEPGVMLYSHNVLIQEYCPELLPSWLSFVDGIVDSEDLPLNVSRETVQNNRLMEQLGKSIKARIVRELKKMAENDPQRYMQFFESFGPLLKEGIATDPESQAVILPLLRYQSVNSPGEWISLDQYVDRMNPGQGDIYYVVGDSLKSAERSPHLDPFKARNLDVLLWHDPLDIFIAPMLGEFREKRFRNAADPEIALSPIDHEADGTQDEPTVAEPDFNRFVGRCVTTLGRRVTEVRASQVLRDSPVRLLGINGAQSEMQRIYRMMGREYEVPAHILEVNRNHPLIAGLSRLVTDKPDSPLISLAIEQLYDSALMQEGLHPNPSEMLPRVEELLMIATDALVNPSATEDR